MENRSRTVIPSTSVIDTYFKLFCYVGIGPIYGKTRGTGFVKKKKKRKKENDEIQIQPGIFHRRAESTLLHA